MQYYHLIVYKAKTQNMNKYFIVRVEKYGWSGNWNNNNILSRPKCYILQRTEKLHTPVRFITGPFVQHLSINLALMKKDTFYNEL